MLTMLTYGARTNYKTVKKFCYTNDKVAVGRHAEDISQTSHMFRHQNGQNRKDNKTFQNCGTDLIFGNDRNKSRRRKKITELHADYHNITVS